MAKNKYQLGDIAEFLRHFRNESDRACAILARALLEEFVARLLKARFVESADEAGIVGSRGPLGDFAGRTAVAHAFGLIADDEKRDLDTIRSIGNDFAHGLDHTMTFDDVSIRDRVWLISGPKALLDFPWSFAKEPLYEEARTIPRRRFEMAVGLLWWSLDFRASQIARAGATSSILDYAREYPSEAAKPWVPYP